MNIQFIFALFFTCTVLSQESFEFKSPLPPNAELVQALSTSYFGSYENSETGTEFLVNEDGITMISIIHSYITQEQVRESSKYSFRNGYLFGIIEKDSVLYLQEDDKYYFGIKNKVVLNDAKNQAIFKKVSENTYIINFKEGQNFTPSLLTFVGNKLNLKHFDYPSETNIFNKIKDSQKIKVGEIKNFILNPTQIEWEKLDQKIIFGKANVFLKK
jgi:hypothetical protein